MNIGKQVHLIRKRSFVLGRTQAVQNMVRRINAFETIQTKSTKISTNNVPTKVDGITLAISTVIYLHGN